MTNTENSGMNDPGAHSAPGTPAFVAYYLAAAVVAFFSYAGFKIVSSWINSDLTIHEAGVIVPIWGFFGATGLFIVLATFGPAMKFLPVERISQISTFTKTVFLLCCLMASICSVPVFKDISFYLFDNVMRVVTQAMSGESPTCRNLSLSEMHVLRESIYKIQCDFSALLAWLFGAALAVRLFAYLGGHRAAIAMAAQ